VKIDLIDDKTLQVTPESVPELLALRAFVGGSVQLEEPQPFAANVQVLIVKKPETGGNA
jgi:hypothetical protein